MREHCSREQPFVFTQPKFNLSLRFPNNETVKWTKEYPSSSYAGSKKTKQKTTHIGCSITSVLRLWKLFIHFFFHSAQRFDEKATFLLIVLNWTSLLTSWLALYFTPLNLLGVTASSSFFIRNTTVNLPQKIAFATVPNPAGFSLSSQWLRNKRLVTTYLFIENRIFFYWKVLLPFEGKTGRENPVYQKFYILQEVLRIQTLITK